MCPPSFLIILTIFACSQFSKTQAQDGNSCRTPDQQPGICISIYNCTTLLDLLVTQNRNPTTRTFLRSSVCGQKGLIPLVCCPESLSTTTTTSPRSTNSKLPKSPDCGFRNVSTPRIVNGVPAKLDNAEQNTDNECCKCVFFSGEFPWIVALGYRNSKNANLPKWLCGGSLITNIHILTAAHCVYNRDDLYLARLGDLDLFSDEDGATPSSIQISKVKIHESFNPARYANDIAILTLQEPVKNPTVWPICLPKDQPYRSLNYLNFAPTLAGWGSISFKGPLSSFLQEIFVPVVSSDNCARVFARRAVIDDKIICAGSGNGDKDACGGDSGAPLMNEISEGTNYRVYQIGIVSYGFKCAEPGYPGVYTRITAFIDWIENNLN